MSNIENLDSIINEMADSVNEIKSFKEGYQKLNTIQTELQEGLKFLNENKEHLNWINTKFDQLQKTILDDIIDEINDIKNQINVKYNELNNRAQNLEHTYGVRTNQLQDRITNLDSNFADKLTIVKDSITNLDSNLTNKTENINTQITILKNDVTKQHSIIRKNIIDEISTKYNELKNTLELNQKAVKHYFITVLILLIFLLGANAFIIYILLNTTKL